MSGCGCIDSDPDSAKSRKIDRELRREQKQLKRQVKILLLGSGESGKSTFLKQMHIIHGREWTADELREYRGIIYQNVVNGMRVLVDARDKLHIPWENSRRQSAADKLLSLNTAQTRAMDVKTFSELHPLIKDLWDDASVRQVYDKRALFQLAESCKYFFEHINRVAQLDYVPTNRDVLLSRKATRGIIEHILDIRNVPFRFVDVGGQRSQRQKWFQCFEGITCILFLVATNEYDQVILEDRRTNRVVESLNVFETIVNHRSFANVSIILFMNKTDLLTEKVPVSDIRSYFAEFKGNHKSIKDVQQFLMHLYDSVRKEKNKPFFYHYTTAVDTENIRRVFEDCREIILEQNLRSLMMQ